MENKEKAIETRKIFLSSFKVAKRENKHRI